MFILLLIWYDKKKNGFLRKQSWRKSDKNSFVMCKWRQFRKVCVRSQQNYLSAEYSGREGWKDINETLWWLINLIWLITWAMTDMIILYFIWMWGPHLIDVFILHRYIWKKKLNQVQLKLGSSSDYMTWAGSQLIYIPKKEIRKRALLWKVNSVLIGYSIHLSSPLIARHNLQKQIPHCSFFFMVGPGKMIDIYRTPRLVLWNGEILL